MISLQKARRCFIPVPGWYPPGPAPTAASTRPQEARAEVRLTLNTTPGQSSHVRRATESVKDSLTVALTSSGRRLLKVAAETRWKDTPICLTALHLCVSAVSKHRCLWPDLKKASPVCRTESVLVKPTRPLTQTTQGSSN